MNGATVNQTLCIFNNIRKIAKYLPDFFLRKHNLIRTGFFAFRQATQQRIVVHRTQKPVDIKIAFIAKSDRLQHNQFFPVVSQVAKYFTYLRWFYTDKFILVQQFWRYFPNRVNKIHVLHFRSPFCKISFFVQMHCKVLVQLLKTTVILGNADILLLCAISEIDAHNRTQIFSFAAADKINGG